MLNKSIITQYLNIAKIAAGKGSEVLQKYWGNLSSIENKKQSGNLVTEADKESEKEILKTLHTHCPDHSILAEESGFHNNSEKEFLWAIDPLDATTNYAHQFPFVSVSIALLYQGAPIVGVVQNPILNELFYAAFGLGAYCNEEKISVSNVTSIEKSLLATGFPYHRAEIEDNNYKEFCHLTSLSQGVRRAGCASLDLAYVAQGKLDGFWENYLNPWDIAAGALLVQEAGGVVTEYDGTPLNYMKPKILASNGKFHLDLQNALLRKP